MAIRGISQPLREDKQLDEFKVPFYYNGAVEAVIDRVYRDFMGLPHQASGATANGQPHFPPITNEIQEQFKICNDWLLAHPCETLPREASLPPEISEQVGDYLAWLEKTKKAAKHLIEKADIRITEENFATGPWPPTQITYPGSRGETAVEAIYDLPDSYAYRLLDQVRQSIRYGAPIEDVGSPEYIARQAWIDAILEESEEIRGQLSQNVKDANGWKQGPTPRQIDKPLTEKPLPNEIVPAQPTAVTEVVVDRLYLDWINKSIEDGPPVTANILAQFEIYNHWLNENGGMDPAKDELCIPPGARAKVQDYLDWQIQVREAAREWIDKTDISSANIKPRNAEAATPVQTIDQLPAEEAFGLLKDMRLCVKGWSHVDPHTAVENMFRQAWFDAMIQKHQEIWDEKLATEFKQVNQWERPNPRQPILKIIPEGPNARCHKVKSFNDPLVQKVTDAVFGALIPKDTAADASTGSEVTLAALGIRPITASIREQCEAYEEGMLAVHQALREQHRWEARKKRAEREDRSFEVPKPWPSPEELRWELERNSRAYLDWLDHAKTALQTFIANQDLRGTGIMEAEGAVKEPAADKPAKITLDALHPAQAYRLLDQVRQKVSHGTEKPEKFSDSYILRQAWFDAIIDKTVRVKEGIPAEAILANDWLADPAPRRIDVGYTHDFETNVKVPVFAQTTIAEMAGVLYSALSTNAAGPLTAGQTAPVIPPISDDVITQFVKYNQSLLEFPPQDLDMDKDLPRQILEDTKQYRQWLAKAKAAIRQSLLETDISHIAVAYKDQEPATPVGSINSLINKDPARAYRLINQVREHVRHVMKGPEDKTCRENIIRQAWFDTIIELGESLRSSLDPDVRHENNWNSKMAPRRVDLDFLPPEACAKHLRAAQEKELEDNRQREADRIEKARKNRDDAKKAKEKAERDARKEERRERRRERRQKWREDHPRLVTAGKVTGLAAAGLATVAGVLFAAKKSADKVYGEDVVNAKITSYVDEATKEYERWNAQRKQNAADDARLAEWQLDLKKQKADLERQQLKSDSNPLFARVKHPIDARGRIAYIPANLAKLMAATPQELTVENIAKTLNISKGEAATGVLGEVKVYQLKDLVVKIKDTPKHGNVLAELQLKDWVQSGLIPVTREVLQGIASARPDDSNPIYYALQGAAANRKGHEFGHGDHFPVSAYVLEGNETPETILKNPHSPKAQQPHESDLVANEKRKSKANPFESFKFVPGPDEKVYFPDSPETSPSREELIAKWEGELREIRRTQQERVQQQAEVPEVKDIKDRIRKRNNGSRVSALEAEEQRHTSQTMR